MSLSRDIREIVDRLVLVAESDHYLIHYELRNPALGRGLGAHGVRDHELIATYQAALEKLYQTMTSEPWNRDPPIVGPDGKTHVYVFNSGHPFTAYDGVTKIPYIVLTSRNNEPTSNAELHRATAEAVHEATHLFNYSQRPLWDKIPAKRWEWFDEGLAVLMEMLVATDNPDHFRFLMDWIDSPEVSLDLDHPAVKYQAGMFIHYVKDRLGHEFVNDVWQNSNPDEGPLQALERLMPEGQRFFSSDAEVQDIFAGYCVEPYYLWHHASEVFLRYGERAVRESLRLPDRNDGEIKDALNHLSCRYYRFYLGDGVETVEVTMSVDSRCADTPLKAQVAVVTRDRQRIMLQPLRPTANGSNGDNCFSCVLRGLNAAEVDHIVLVVSNCGTNLSLNGSFGSDDSRQYTVKGRAH